MRKRGIIAFILFFFVLGLRAQQYEQQLTDVFAHSEALRMIFAFNGNAENPDSLFLRFKVLEKPSSGSPYYRLQGYDNRQPIEDARFLVGANDQMVYHINYSGKRIPLKSWGQEELMNIRAYYKERSEITPKFKIDQGLLELENWKLPVLASVNK